MPLEIIAVLTILAIAIVLFITEWVRMKAVALLVLTSLAIAGLLTPVEALSRFSNPAVVSVGSVNSQQRIGAHRCCQLDRAAFDAPGRV